MILYSNNNNNKMTNSEISATSPTNVCFWHLLIDELIITLLIMVAVPYMAGISYTNKQGYVDWDRFI